MPQNHRRTAVLISPAVRLARLPTMRYTDALDTGHKMRHHQVSTERRQSGDLAALNAVAEAIAGSLSLTAVLDALGRVLADRLRIAGGAAFLPSRPDGRTTARANWGVPARVLAAIEARLQAGWDEPAATGEPRPADIITGGGGPFLRLSVEHADPSWQSCLCIPFSGGARFPGVLVLFGLASSDDEAARTAALELLGRLVGAAVRNARLHARVHANRRRLTDLARRLIAAQEEERRRIARELHEEIAQTLAAARINEMLAIDGSAAPDAACPRAKNINLLNSTIEQIQALTLDLRPMTLDDFGIVAASDPTSRRSPSERGSRSDSTPTLASAGSPLKWRRLASAWPRRRSPTRSGTPRRGKSGSGSATGPACWP